MSANPKDLIGSMKVSLTKIPPVALAHTAEAMMDGAKKYGPYNWREHAVQADTYVDAALRHLLAWWDGERTASDSHVHHLGHAAACCAILMDAEAYGGLSDNRPAKRGAFLALTKAIQQRLEKRNDQTLLTASALGSVAIEQLSFIFPPHDSGDRPTALGSIRQRIASLGDVGGLNSTRDAERPSPPAVGEPRGPGLPPR